MNKEETKDNLEECKCFKCDVELKTAHVGDANGGSVLVTVWVRYCPECLFIDDSQISLSK